MLWLDTDIGTDIDDALTLSYLLARPDVDLLGISTVTVSSVERARLAAAICREFGQPNLRVFAGTERPLIHPHRQTEYPQTAAVEPSMLVAVDEQVAKTGAHIEAMYRAALRWPGEVHLLAIGPLTNLALLARTHPDVVDLLASVTLMAGRYYGSALNEWNVWCDPHAAAIVFESFKGIRAVGLERHAQDHPAGRRHLEGLSPRGTDGQPGDRDLPAQAEARADLPARSAGGRLRGG